MMSHYFSLLVPLFPWMDGWTRKSLRFLCSLKFFFLVVFWISNFNCTYPFLALGFKFYFSTSRTSSFLSPTITFYKPYFCTWNFGFGLHFVFCCKWLVKKITIKFLWVKKWMAPLWVSPIKIMNQIKSWTNHPVSRSKNNSIIIWAFQLT